MKTKEEIQAHLDATVNTLLGQHRGRVDVIDVFENNPVAIDGLITTANLVVVRMSGGCQGCAGAKATIKTIVTNEVKTFDPSVDKIVDITDHTNNTNAFFKV